MSAVSSVGSGSTVYQPATANVAKPKSTPVQTTTQGGSSDPDHDGDSGGGLDVKG